MTAREALRRACRGAKLLDAERPGWARRVRITKLDQAQGSLSESGCGCVLAQVDGSYEDGRFALGLTWPDDDVRLGFDTLDDDYGRLTEAWRAVIRTRRASA